MTKIFLANCYFMVRVRKSQIHFEGVDHTQFFEF